MRLIIGHSSVITFDDIGIDESWRIIPDRFHDLLQAYLFVVDIWKERLAVSGLLPVAVWVIRRAKLSISHSKIQGYPALTIA